MNDVLKEAQKEIDEAGSAYSAEEKWSVIVPFHQYDLPEYPLDVLPEPYLNFIMGVAEELTIHPDLAANSLLPIIGSTVQKKYAVKFKGGLFPLNAYSLSVAKSGEGKSPTNYRMVRPILEYEQELRERVADEIAEHNAEREMKEREYKHLSEQAVKSKEGKETFREQAKELAAELAKSQVKHDPQFIVDDVTAEGLSIFLHRQGETGLAFSSEGDLIAIMLGRYSGASNFRVWLDAYDGNPIRINRRRGKPILLNNPIMSMALSMQPVVLRQEVSRYGALTEKGFIARCLWSWPKSTLGYKEESDYELEESFQRDYTRAIRALLELPVPEEPHPISLSVEAMAKYREYYSENQKELRSGGRLEELTGWGGKFRGHMMRLSGLLHVAHCSVVGIIGSEISSETVENAHRLWQYHTQHILAVFAEMGESEEIERAKYVLQKVKLVSKDERGVFTSKDLFEKARAQMTETMEKLQLGLHTLESHGYIRRMVDHDIRPGRKHDYWQAHPDIANHVHPLMVPQNTQNHISETVKLDSVKSYA